MWMVSDTGWVHIALTAGLGSLPLFQAPGDLCIGMCLDPCDAAVLRRLAVQSWERLLDDVLTCNEFYACAFSG